MINYRLVLLLILFSLTPVFAKTIVRYQYDSTKYNTYTNKGPEVTYRAFSNTTNSNATYEISVKTQTCYSWSISVSLLNAAGLGTSKTGCSDHTYSAKMTVGPYKTAKTFKREMLRVDYYKINKLAVYSDGSSKVVDTTYGDKKDTWVDMWTNVY